MLERIDALTTKIDELTARIDQVIAPFAHQVAQLDEITGSRWLRPRAHRRDRRGHDRLPHRRAPGLLGEVLPACPPVSRQAREASTGKGNPWLAGTLGEIVAALAAPIPSSASATGA